MVINVIFTIILCAILAATYAVVKSNIKLRQTVSPEKKIDLRVGNDSQLKIRQNEEGNITIEISHVLDDGSLAPTPMTQEQATKEVEELADLGFDREQARMEASSIWDIESLPFSERKAVLERDFRNGRYTKDQYERLLKKYTSEDVPSPATKAAESADKKEEVAGKTDDAVLQEESKGGSPERKEVEQTLFPSGNDDADKGDDNDDDDENDDDGMEPSDYPDGNMASGGPSQNIKHGLDTPDPDPLFNKMFGINK